MGYYRGDGSNYTGGGYYRGDPFLGAVLGGLVSKAGRWAVKRITGKGLKRAAVGTAIAVGTQVAPRIPTPGGGNIDLGAILPGGDPFYTPRRKYRKMNPLNPRALKRALRRAEGFEQFAARTVNALYKQVGGRRTRVFKKC